MSELMHFSKHYIVTIGKAWLLNINTNKAHIKILYDCLRLYCEGRNIQKFTWRQIRIHATPTSNINHIKKYRITLIFISFVKKLLK